MRATCYVVWTDGNRSHFSFSYGKEDLAGFSSFDEFLLTRCLKIYPARTRKEIKWIIKEQN